MAFIQIVIEVQTENPLIAQMWIKIIDPAAIFERLENQRDISFADALHQTT